MLGKSSNSIHVEHYGIIPTVLYYIRHSDLYDIKTKSNFSNYFVSFQAISLYFLGLGGLMWTYCY